MNISDLGGVGVYYTLPFLLINNPFPASCFFSQPSGLQCFVLSGQQMGPPHIHPAL